MTEFRPWTVVHRQLEDLPEALEAPTGAGGVLLVDWWRDLPVAVQEFAADQLPVPGAQLRALAVERVGTAVAGWLSESSDTRELGLDAGLARPLERLDQLRDGAPESGASLSVVICTRDRPAQLTACLAALARLRPLPDEVLVVDNAPDRPGTRDVCDAAGVRYVAEPRPGLSVARNTGVAHSRGELVAFTDDDVQVHHTWVRELRRAFADERAAFVTGLVLPAELDTESQWFFETEFGGFGRRLVPAWFGPEYMDRYRAIGTPVWLLGAGANMAFRRSALATAGGFDERLGAGAAGCSEDSELWYRLLAAGLSCRYSPAAVVHHQHRQDMTGLAGQLRSYMRGHVAALLVQHERHGHRGNLWRIGLTLPRHHLGVWLRTLVLRQSVRRRLLRAEVLGGLAGIGYYLRHRGDRGGERT